MEPPDWFSPAPSRWADMLLTSGNPAGAEAVFREDLDRNPRGGHSLFGLMKSLEAQKKNYEARLVERRIRHRVEELGHEAEWRTVIRIRA